MARRRASSNGASDRPTAAQDATEEDQAPTSTAERTEETNGVPSPLRATEAEPPQPQPVASTTEEEGATSRSANGGGIADSDSSDEVSEDSEIGVNGDGGDAGPDADESEDDDSESEEEILVVLELADFKNHPILDDYKSITIEGIDTPKPTLHIGEYSLHGQLEETVGTHYFYDTKNRTEDNEYQFVGQTTKKIKFTIAPPEEY